MSARDTDDDDDGSQPAVRKLVSRRNDLSKFDTPEITWEFYDRYHSAKPTRAAFEMRTNSIEEGNLDSFFKTTLSRSKFSSMEAFLEEKPTNESKFDKLPHPFNLLMPLQDPFDFKWYDLKAVLHILKLPRDTRLEKATKWETASAFVLAMIRQQVEIFSQLQEYHDKAIVNFPSSQLIQEAKEIILIGDLTKDMSKILKSRGVLSAANTGYNNSDSESDYDSDGNKYTIAQKKAVKAGTFVRSASEKRSERTETYQPIKGSLLAPDDPNSVDPSMRPPIQEDFEKMTTTLLADGPGGIFLPRPKPTKMKVMNSTTLIPETEPLANEDDDQSNNVRLVDDDYELNSDEEWATDSEDEKSIKSAGEIAAGEYFDKLEDEEAMRGESPKKHVRPKSRDGSLDSRDSKRSETLSAVSRNDHSPITTPTVPNRGGLSRGASRQSSSPMKVSFGGLGLEEQKANEGDALGKTADVNTLDTAPVALEPLTPTKDAISVITEGNGGSWAPESIDMTDGAGSVGTEGSIESAESEASLLTKSLRSLTPQKDKSRIKKVQMELDDIMIGLVEAAHEVEKQCDRIKDALVRGILDYNAKLTYEERNLVFDELTAMLGDDYPAREGFFDWRATGVPGIRPRVVKFFCLVHEMARLRLELHELNTPEGRNVHDKVKHLDTPGCPWVYNDDNEEDLEDIGRWSFVYNGVDVVTKVLHCLDFLRGQKEICSWFGRTFYFCANPMMLPFNVYRVFDSFDLTNKLKEQLMTKAHVRPMCSIGGEGFNVVSTAPGSPTYDKCGGDILGLGKKSLWKFEKWLAQFRINFNDLCAEKRMQNWPCSPNIKSYEDCLAVYTSLCVMFIRCKATLVKTFYWEKKFISLLSTVRGKDLMIGFSGIKPDLMLDRQTEQRFILAKEEKELQRIAAEQQAAIDEAEREANAENPSLKFLSSVMQATAKPTKKGKTDAEIAAEMAAFERLLIFRRLTTARNYVDLNDPNYKYPFPELFEGWSSVNTPKIPDSALNLGFGASPTRSPPRPNSALLNTGTFYTPSYQLPPLTISSTLYQPPYETEEIVATSKKKKKTDKKSPEKGVTTTDTGSVDGSVESDSIKSGEPKGKKSTSTPKSKRTKREPNVVSRKVVAEAAEKNSKVSRVKTIPQQSLTRRVKEETLPPVRTGGGGFTQEIRSPLIKRKAKLR